MFRTSTPVIDKAFFDRVAELAQLEESVQSLRAGSPRWLALLGQRKVGKTSLLLELMRRAHGGNVLFVVIDSFEDRPLSLAIFRRLGLRVVDAFLSRSLGLSLEAMAKKPAEYRAALVGAEDFSRLPQDLRSDLLELADAALDSHLAQTALGLAERLAVALDKLCIVAWDEFQELARLTTKTGSDVLALARAVWQRHSHTSYIICGSERTMLRSMGNSQWSATWYPGQAFRHAFALHKG
jgi:AAA+ ATPase superfamily predicted ATPase